MTLGTRGLHLRLVDDLQPHVVSHSDLAVKPLDLDLLPPLPARLRCYLYSLVVGGQSRPNEFKAVLRVPGQPVGEYGAFNHAPGRLTLVLAYREDLNVWVLWDALLHPRFKNGGNIQVRRKVIFDAAGSGWQVQVRTVARRQREVIIACRGERLNQAICQRFLLMVEEMPP